MAIDGPDPVEPAPATWEWPGSRWWRCDLHVHSPASYDFTDRNTTSATDLVQAAQQAGIDAIAVTDHNTAEAVEDVSQAGAALAPQVVVYPGVELTTQEGAHLLVLFAPGTSADIIKGFLGDCGVDAKEWGTKEALASAGYAECITKAAETHGALCIAAHADRAPGEKKPTSLLHVIPGGQPLQRILGLPSLHAVEVTTDDPDVLRRLRGEDHQTGRVLRSVVWASDAHALDQVGQVSTWIKMTRPDEQGLRLALADGDTSLLPHEAASPNDHSAAVVESITIEDTKLIGTGQPFELRLNPWLNSIIGGRGTGKSSVVEFLRLALRRDRELPPALAQTFKELARRPDANSDKGLLRANSRITVIYRKDGTRFRITWPDTQGVSPISEERDGVWEPAEGEVTQRFPIRIYSQKQVFELAQDPAALLTVVDDSNHVKKANWERDWREAETTFLALRARVRELEETLADEQRLRGELDDLNKRLAVFERSKHREVLTAYRKRRSQAAAIEEWEAEISGIADDLSATADAIAPSFNEEVFDKSDPVDAELLDAMGRERDSVADVRDKVKNASEALGRQLGAWELQKGDLRWTAEDANATAAYEDLLKELEAEGAGSPEEYAQLVEARVQLLQRVASLDERRVELDGLQSEATAALDSLHGLRRDLTERRTAFMSDVLTGNRHVEITVRAFGDKADAEASLRALLGLEGSFQNDIASPEGTGLLDHLYGGAALDEDSVERLRERLIACARGDEPAWAVRDRRFVAALRGLRPEVLDRLAFWAPEDSLEVAYSRRGDGTGFEPIGRGSPGEKTAAILAFLLSYGDEPIVLDQPEDDLDNRLIYDLIVDQLKENKKRRQIVVVTHNPNIVVNGDSEFIASFDFQTGHTVISQSGGLQEDDVREEICAVMEGGRAAFEERYQRIGRPQRRR